MGLLRLTGYWVPNGEIVLESQLGAVCVEVRVRRTEFFYYRGGECWLGREIVWGG